MAKDNNKIFQTVVIIGGVYFLVLMPILKKLGIIKDATLEEAETSNPNTNPWSGAAYIKAAKMRPQTLGNSKINYAKIIFDALPEFGNDDFSAIKSVFNSLKTKSELASLSEYFKIKYQYDLLDYLQRGKSKKVLTWSSVLSGLSSSQVQQLLNIVKSLPNYKVK